MSLRFDRKMCAEGHNKVLIYEHKDIPPCRYELEEELWYSKNYEDFMKAPTYAYVGKGFKIIYRNLIKCYLELECEYGSLVKTFYRNMQIYVISRIFHYMLNELLKCSDENYIRNIIKNTFFDKYFNKLCISYSISLRNYNCEIVFPRKDKTIYSEVLV